MLVGGATAQQLQSPPTPSPTVTLENQLRQQLMQQQVVRQQQQQQPLQQQFNNTGMLGLLSQGPPQQQQQQQRFSGPAQQPQQGEEVTRGECGAGSGAGARVGLLGGVG